MMNEPWFLAILDTRAYEYEHYRYSVCFINQSDQIINGIEYTAKGSIKAYNRTLSEAEESRSLGELKPQYVVEIEHIPKNGFIEDMSYTFTIRIGDRTEEITYIVPKNLSGAAYSLFDLPVVQQRGYIFPPNRPDTGVK
ncbi:hypothetical protein [Jeotgalibacillus aurantiacus]|uniref:hypothetical protein n=1 Tax=Jeotgalibacillus aurantiacus TaxID=2763266 RepID=UPI001D0AC606|nr:hypothetical protein [Jeotgalibacillus aurantiacus]